MNRDHLTGTALEIVEQCDFVAGMLLEKNRQYGDSALDPLRVFCCCDPVEQLNVRIDDKLSRIRSAQGDDQEDAELDLIGYLVLKRVALRRQLVRAGVPAMRRRRYWDRVSGEQPSSLADAGDGGPGAVGSPAPEIAGSPSTQTDEDAPGRDGSVRDWPDDDVAGVEPLVMRPVLDLGFLCGKRRECSP